MLINKLDNVEVNIENGHKTKNEQNGYEEISIFKDGVVL